MAVKFPSILVTEQLYFSGNNIAASSKFVAHWTPDPSVLVWPEGVQTTSCPTRSIAATQKALLLHVQTCTQGFCLVAQGLRVLYTIRCHRDITRSFGWSSISSCGC